MKLTKAGEEPITNPDNLASKVADKQSSNLAEKMQALKKPAKVATETEKVLKRSWKGDPTKYKKSPIAQIVNASDADMKEFNVGGYLAGTCDYYGLPYDHPLVGLVISLGQTGMKKYKRKQQESEAQNDPDISTGKRTIGISG